MIWRDKKSLDQRHKDYKTRFEELKKEYTNFRDDFDGVYTVEQRAESLLSEADIEDIVNNIKNKYWKPEGKIRGDEMYSLIAGEIFKVVAVLHTRNARKISIVVEYINGKNEEINMNVDRYSMWNDIYEEGTDDEWMIARIS
jgi:hypothetical protein